MIYPFLRRSEEHTSELQSLRHLVCRLLLYTSTTELYTLSLHDALPICCHSMAALSPRSSSKLGRSSEEIRRTDLTVSSSITSISFILVFTGSSFMPIFLLIHDISIFKKIGRAHV